MRHRTKPQEPLLPHTEVHVKDQDQPGIVLRKAETPRSYIVETPTSTIRRNSSQLLKMPPGAEGKVKESPPVTEPTKSEVPVKAPPSPCLNSRPKRSPKPSLKVRENLGLA